MALIKDYHVQYFRLYLLLIYHYTLSVPGYSNMEVLTSMNRMSATTFLSLYVSSEYGTGLHFNVTGPADNAFLRIFRYKLDNHCVLDIVLSTILCTTGHHL